MGKMETAHMNWDRLPSPTESKEALPLLEFSSAKCISVTILEFSEPS